MAKSAFPESHELHFGWPGMHGPKWSNYAINKSDLLIAVGSRFDDRVTGKLSRVRARRADVIHFDIDPAEIGKLRKADIPVVGPLKRGARRAREGARASRRVAGRTEPWLRQIAAWRERVPAPLRHAAERADEAAARLRGSCRR